MDPFVTLIGIVLIDQFKKKLQWLFRVLANCTQREIKSLEEIGPWDLESMGTEFCQYSSPDFSIRLNNELRVWDLIMEFSL